MSLNLVIGFIGGGNMARAIAEGILKKGLINSSQLIISAPSAQTVEKWKNLSVQTTHSNSEVISNADIIFLAFKPHQLDLVLKNIEIDSYKSKEKLFVSILAGVTCETIFDKLTLCMKMNPPFVFQGRIIRVMPNTLALIGEGCSAIAPHSSAKPEDIIAVQEIFTALGKCEIVPEYLISAITGLSGSGPAYIYMIIEALSDGGVKQGLPRNLATTFAAQTVLGAAKMVLDTKKHPGQLKDEVCSAGGTTIHALHALELGGLRATIMNAVQAAANRADEISNMSKLK